MTPETLKMYKKLQPLFREKMGPAAIKADEGDCGGGGECLNS